jgi:outer membrane protein assembly factor BamB
MRYRIKHAWRYKPKLIERGRGPIFISPSEKYVLGVFDNKICTHDILGELLWKRKVGTFPWGKIWDVVFSHDFEFLMISCWNGNMLCLDEKGQLIWEKKISNSWGPLSISEDFSLILGGNKREIFLIDNKGKPIWNNKLGSYVLNTEISLEKDMLIATTIKKMFCYDLNGKLKWENKMKGFMMVVDINKQNNCIIANNMDTLFCLDEKGNIIWSKEFKGIHIRVKTFDKDKIMVLERIYNFTGPDQNIIHFIDINGNYICREDITDETRYLNDINSIDISASGHHIITKNQARINCYEITASK